MKTAKAAPLASARTRSAVSPAAAVSLRHVSAIPSRNPPTICTHPSTASRSASDQNSWDKSASERARESKHACATDSPLFNRKPEHTCICGGPIRWLSVATLCSTGNPNTSTLCSTGNPNTHAYAVLYDGGRAPTMAFRSPLQMHSKQDPRGPCVAAAGGARQGWCTHNTDDSLFTSQPSTQFVKQLMVFRQALAGLSGYGEIRPDH